MTNPAIGRLNVKPAHIGCFVKHNSLYPSSVARVEQQASAGFSARRACRRAPSVTLKLRTAMRRMTDVKEEFSRAVWPHALDVANGTQPEFAAQ